MRLIYVDAYSKKVCTYNETGCGSCNVQTICPFDEPIVDAEPVKHGKWIDEGQYADFFPHHAWRCSECGEHVIEIDTPWYKYCPNCGARMDEE